MKWMRERDLLIAQTMAFVQSVTGKKPDPGLFGAAPEVSEPATTAVAVAQVETVLSDAGMLAKPARTAPIAQPEFRLDFQSEVTARVANFRAHQERFSRERDEYCRATMARAHAALRGTSEREQPEG